MTSRRDFISLLGGAAATWPVAARGQRRRIPTIGFIGASTSSAWAAMDCCFCTAATRAWLARGANLNIEYRWSGGRRESLAEIAAEFVRINVDVIFAPVTLAALAAKEATSTIPIVFALVGEPVAVKLITSLARPGGNVTGTSNQSTDIGSKRLEILREVIPNLPRSATLANVANPATMIETCHVGAAAAALGSEGEHSRHQHPERDRGSPSRRLDRPSGGSTSRRCLSSFPTRIAALGLRRGETTDHAAGNERLPRLGA